MDTRQEPIIFQVLSSQDVIASFDVLMNRYEQSEHALKLKAIKESWEQMINRLNTDPSQVHSLRDPLRAQLHQCMNESQAAQKEEEFEIFYQAALTLAYLSPLNDVDVIYQEKIEAENKIVTSDGYQFHIEYLKKLLSYQARNPYTRVPFSERDTKTLKDFFNSKYPNAVIRFHHAPRWNNDYLPVTQDHVPDVQLIFLAMLSINRRTLFNFLQRMEQRLPSNFIYMVGIGGFFLLAHETVDSFYPLQINIENISSTLMLRIFSVLNTLRQHLQAHEVSSDESEAISTLEIEEEEIEEVENSAPYSLQDSISYVSKMSATFIMSTFRTFHTWISTDDLSVSQQNNTIEPEAERSEFRNLTHQVIRLFSRPCANVTAAGLAAFNNLISEPTLQPQEENNLEAEETGRRWYF